MNKIIKKITILLTFGTTIFLLNQQTIFCKSNVKKNKPKITIVISRKHNDKNTNISKIKEKIEIAYSAYKAQQYQSSLSIIENILKDFKINKTKQYNFIQLYAVSLYLKAQIYLQTGEKNKAKHLLKIISKKYTDIMYMFSDGTIIQPAYQSQKELKDL